MEKGGCMIREEYNFWLGNLPNIGAVKIEFLLQLFDNAEGVFHATEKELKEAMDCSRKLNARLSEHDITAILNNRDEKKILIQYRKLIKDGVKFITKEDTGYPKKLREIYGAPFALYVRGKLPNEDSKAIAVVGARECSPYGIEMASYLAEALAQEGVEVISGLARGIDSFAHKGALLAGGTTYGVLGCGIDICYPKENIQIFMEIQDKGGLLSEFGPGVKPLSGNFPMRNRIISGLSDGILVIEAKEKSGSLITVDIGLEQGKDIFAVPGKATDRLSSGCNNLIKMGAKLVTSPMDILEELHIKYSKCESSEKEKKERCLEDKERKVYDTLNLTPKHIDVIMKETGLSVDALMELLLSLEFKDMIRQTTKNFYIARQFD